MPPNENAENQADSVLSTTAFKKSTQEVIDFYAAQAATPIPGVPKFDSKRVVDGQRLIQFLKPLPTTSEGRKFELRSKVLGVYDKGKPGSVVETEQLIVDKESGEVYTRAVGSGFFVGQGGWGGPKGPATQNFPPPKGRENKPDAISETQLTAESAHLYRLVLPWNVDGESKLCVCMCVYVTIC
jgi:peroxisomal enoyl-CoA hydratase 2